MSKRYVGLFTGILAFIVILALPEPEGLSPQGKNAAAVVVLMSIWWISEAIPVYVTAFLPLVLYPILKILTPANTAANYGHNYALMFLAVFFLAKAIETQNLHKRIALSIINVFGTDRKRIVLSMMIATALVSMWIANVTTALMMLPIALAILSKEGIGKNDDQNRFASALMLGIAYSASIGGLATLIGSPTNMIFVGIFDRLFPEAPPITFFTWLKIGLPILIIFIPVFWYFIVKYFKVTGTLSDNLQVISDELKALGTMTSGERRVLYLAIATVLGWVFKDDLVLGDVVVPGWTGLFGLEGYVHDSTIAMTSAIILFALPAAKGKRLITWKEASQVPWGVVMIVGGGYAVADGFESTGLADWLGDQLMFIQGFPFLIILIFVLAFVLMFTEFNSNTASANILLPILASTAVAASVNPLLIMIPATIACSCAFMMPAATGPNTVVLASERVSVAQMVKCGFWLNLITLVLLTVILYFVIIPWLDLEMTLPAWAK
jgi:solute carrier family 13 (sodium-dependent dicarboxylate transporter), member 2/3/5